MCSIHVHVSAESDLIDTWRYSFEEWGEVRADKYLDELELAENPEVGMKRDYVREGYRALFVGNHAVYYMVTPAAIHIIRALHGRMDPDRHLE
jgi:toxin ParE1/3/4